MSDEQPELKRGMDDLAASEQRAHPAHLTRDELQAYASGDLRADQETPAQDHLVWCRHCTQRLLALVGSDHVQAEPGAPVSDAEVASAWETTKAAIGLSDRRRAADRRQFFEAFGQPRVAYAVAASLLVVLVALSGWSLTQWQENRRLTVALGAQSQRSDRTTPARDPTASIYERQVAELRQQVEALSEPQPNVLVADLYPPALTRGNAGSVTTLDVPAGTSLITVILNTAVDRQYGEYQVDILDTTGTRMWRGEQLQKTPFGNFTLALPRRRLPPGEYRIDLRGVASGEVTLLDQYRVRILHR